MFYFPLAFSYLGSTNAFKQQLSKEEEDLYIKLYKENDDKEAERILIERNLRLVAHIVKKYSGSNYDNEDLLSIGTIGLIKGVKSFSLDRNIKLATYCAKCIENEILMSLRINKKHKIVGSLSEASAKDKDGHEISVIDRIKDEKMDTENEVIVNLEIKKMISILKDTLTEQELTILKLRYGLNCAPMPQREIAKMLGISRSYVSRIEKKALLKLNKKMQ